MKYYFVFDVESIGLHGEPYAVGFVVKDEVTKTVDSGRFACDPEDASGDPEDREWVKANIPAIVATHTSVEEVLGAFWYKWLEWKEKGALLFAECAWPVEAKFLAMCVHRNWPTQKWNGPYPLHEIASFMEAAGMDPMATYERKGAENPKHDPLADARQSARLLFEALDRISIT